MYESIFIIIATIIVATVGSVFSRAGMNWYHTLRLPAGTPANWIFPIAWNIIFVCTALAAIIAWRKTKGSSRFIISTLFILNGILNVLWSYLFFYMQSPTLAFLDALALQATLISLASLLYAVSYSALLLLLPYILWIFYALYLNLGVILLNR